MGTSHCLIVSSAFCVSVWRVAGWFPNRNLQDACNFSLFNCLDLCYSGPMKTMTCVHWKGCSTCPPAVPPHSLAHYIYTWTQPTYFTSGSCIYVTKTHYCEPPTPMGSSYLSFISCMLVFWGLSLISRGGWETPSSILSQCPKCWRLTTILFLLVQSLCLLGIGVKRVGFQIRLLQLLISRNPVWSKINSSNLRLRCV